MRLVFWCTLLVISQCIFVDSAITAEDHVVLIAPVLAPPKGARARVTETAKDFPVVMLLATSESQPRAIVEKVPGELKPTRIYVQRLEDLRPANIRRRRKLKEKKKVKICNETK